MILLPAATSPQRWWKEIYRPRPLDSFICFCRLRRRLRRRRRRRHLLLLQDDEFCQLTLYKHHLTGYVTRPLIILNKTNYYCLPFYFGRQQQHLTRHNCNRIHTTSWSSQSLLIRGGAGTKAAASIQQNNNYQSKHTKNRQQLGKTRWRQFCIRRGHCRPSGLGMNPNDSRLHDKHSTTSN